VQKLAATPTLLHYMDAFLNFTDDVSRLHALFLAPPRGFCLLPGEQNTQPFLDWYCFSSPSIIKLKVPTIPFAGPFQSLSSAFVLVEAFRHTPLLDGHALIGDLFFFFPTAFFPVSSTFLSLLHRGTFPPPERAGMSPLGFKVG